VSENDFLRVGANGCPMSSCAAPAGSPCRTSRGRVAAQYHTARFRLVPHLAKAPAQRPGPADSQARLSLDRAAPASDGRHRTGGHVRIGYAGASTIRQSLDIQVDSLHASGVTRIFSEKVSSRAVTRPELDRTVTLAREIRASGAAVTIVVHEHKRLGQPRQRRHAGQQDLPLAPPCRRSQEDRLGTVPVGGDARGFSSLSPVAAPLWAKPLNGIWRVCASIV
jgi:hypothetical protein